MKVCCAAAGRNEGLGLCAEPEAGEWREVFCVSGKTTGMNLLEVRKTTSLMWFAPKPRIYTTKKEKLFDYLKPKVFNRY